MIFLLELSGIFNLRMWQPSHCPAPQKRFNQKKWNFELIIIIKLFISSNVIFRFLQMGGGDCWGMTPQDSIQFFFQDQTRLY